MSIIEMIIYASLALGLILELPKFLGDVTGRNAGAAGTAGANGATPTAPTSNGGVSPIFYLAIAAAVVLFLKWRGIINF